MALTLRASAGAGALPNDANVTPAALFRARCLAGGAAPALRYKRRGIWRSVSWNDYYGSARAVGLALADLGCTAGDVISVLSENRPEWLYVEHGARCMRMIVSAIAPSATEERVRKHLAHAGTSVLFVSSDVTLDLEALFGASAALKAIVLFDARRERAVQHPAMHAFGALLARGLDRAAQTPAAFDEAIDANEPAGMALLQYTFGTTGLPRAVRITNGNLRFQIAQVHAAFPLPPGSRAFSFVAYANIFERVISVYGQLANATVLHFPENASTVQNDLCEVRPEIVFATPRFWEKLASGVELFMRDAIAPARWAFRWSLAHPAARLARLLLRNVRASLGLAEARYVVTGAASVSAEMPAWYAALGIPIVETYGLAETTGPVTLTREVEVRVESDGHVLVRGPMLAAGYRQPDEPLHVDPEGWLATGDCGSLEGGALRIVNRRADLIVNRHGVIAPGSIESRLRFSPYVYDVVVVGHARDYLTALVMIDADGLAAITRDLALEEMTFADLIRTPGVRGVLQEEINRVNAALRPEERIRDFRVIDRLIAAGDGELSPTLRLHRQVAAATYRALIEEMY